MAAAYFKSGQCQIYCLTAQRSHTEKCTILPHASIAELGPITAVINGGTIIRPYNASYSSSVSSSEANNSNNQLHTRYSSI
eukprot:scaffold677372_cov59-Prasinocladus_malaysianus.AAC.1